MVADKNTISSVKDMLEMFREQLLIEKNNINIVNKLVNSEIDQNFELDLWELSPKELDNWMGKNLSILNDNINTVPGPIIAKSHRRFIGRPIVYIKNKIFFYINKYTLPILEKQKIFNSQLVKFHLASFIRLRALDSKLNIIDEKISKIENLNNE